MQSKRISLLRLHREGAAAVDHFWKKEARPLLIALVRSCGTKREDLLGFVTPRLAAFNFSSTHANAPKAMKTKRHH